MPDIFAEWRADLQFTPSGDLKLADGPALTRQRIIRRLLTPVRGYLWHLEYGAGLPQKIGSPVLQRSIESLVRGQIALEASVAPSPPPKITVVESASNQGLFVITIAYLDADLGQHVTLSFDTAGQAGSPAPQF